MKKIGIIIAVVAFAAFAAQAQTTSANIVGYTKVSATGGQLSLVALNFTPSSTSVANLIGDQLPNGSTLHIWDKETGAYNSVTKATRGGWGTVATIELGDAFWIEASGTDTYEILLSGEVNTAETNTVVLSGGIDATGYYYPVETTWGNTDLSAALPNGSTVHFWNGSAYSSFTKATRGGWGVGADTVISATEGFWIQAEATWNEARPFSF
jgi:hypothetical protein